MELRKISCFLLVVYEFSAQRYGMAFSPPAELTPSTTRTTSNEALTSLFLSKKNKKRTQESRGFGKVQEGSVPTTTTKSASTSTTPAAPSSSATSTESKSSPFLQSVEGGSDSVPVMEIPKESGSSSGSSSQLPPEERTKQILREKYGLRSLEEQQFDAKQLELRKEQAKKMQEWRKKVAAEGEDVDIIAMIPGPVLIGLDRFLKAGIAIVGTAFVASGLGITVEAWSKSSGRPLPEDMESFIVNVIEPNFTTELLVLLSFSISLGVLAAAQLGSAGAQYREKD